MKRKAVYLDLFTYHLTALFFAILLIGCQGQPSPEGSEPDNSESTKSVPDNKLDLRISLAQWSLHNAFFGESRSLEGGKFYSRMLKENPKAILMGNKSPDHFPRIASEEFGIYGIELVNTFYLAHVEDQGYWESFKAQCEEVGVQTLLIMCDGLGNLGDADPDARQQAVENHYPWVDIAAFLGCHSIRVNAAGTGTPEMVAEYAKDGLRALTEYAKKKDINVIVENHGGYSSDGKWLAGVISSVEDNHCGTLPDFGNFCIKSGPEGCEQSYDRYLGMKELLPYAKGVSAKSYAFDANGEETTIDFGRMINLIREAPFSGYIGIEYEGNELSEPEGIKATKALLEKYLAG